MPYSEEAQRREEERKRIRAERAAEATRQRQELDAMSAGDESPATQEPKDTRSYQQVAEATDKVEQERGQVTEVGEFLNNALDYASDGGITSDLLNAGAAALNQISGGRLQGLDDSVGRL